MLRLLRKVLTSGVDPDPVREAERVHIATCALLLEMAHADGELHALEETLVAALLGDKFALAPEAVQELMELARQEREQSADLYQFTREINDNFTPGEKLEIMEVLWRIVYADGHLDRYEDALARQLGTLLRLSPRNVIEVKVKILDELQPERPATRSS